MPWMDGWMDEETEKRKEDSVVGGILDPGLMTGKLVIDPKTAPGLSGEVNTCRLPSAKQRGEPTR